MTEAEPLSAISGATLEKAQKVLLPRPACGVRVPCSPQELCEVPQERLQRVLELRLRIEEAEKTSDFDGVVFSRKDNSFLLRFLRARKFQVDRALQLYLNYYKYRHKHSHLLGELSPQSVEHVLHRGFFALLDSPSRCGSRTLVVFPARCVCVCVCVCFLWRCVCRMAEWTWRRFLQWTASRPCYWCWRL